MEAWERGFAAGWWIGERWYRRRQQNAGQGHRRSDQALYGAKRAGKGRSMIARWDDVAW